MKGQRVRTIRFFFDACVVSEEVNRVSPSSLCHYWHLATLHVCVCEELMCHFILVISFSKIQHQLRSRVVLLIGFAEVESNAVGVSPYYFKDVICQ